MYEVFTCLYLFLLCSEMGNDGILFCSKEFHGNFEDPILEKKTIFNSKCNTSLLSSLSQFSVLAYISTTRKKKHTYQLF
jgi:hypothetical protein